MEFKIGEKFFSITHSEYATVLGAYKLEHGDECRDAVIYVADNNEAKFSLSCCIIETQRMDGEELVSLWNKRCEGRS